MLTDVSALLPESSAIIILSDFTATYYCLQISHISMVVSGSEALIKEAY